MQTHEDYIRSLAAFVVMHADLNPTEQAELTGIKLVYGAGENGVRGITYYNRWESGDQLRRPFVEIGAFAQESVVQLAGTTLHELGHVLAGWLAGHNKPWHEACERLGLIGIKAAGTEYSWDNFAPWVRTFAQSLEVPNEGQPVKNLIGTATGLPGIFGQGFKGLRACPAGIGTRGGKSRGVGSGSRLRLYECSCHKPVKIRCASDDLEATHKVCKKPFKLKVYKVCTKPFKFG